MEIENPELAEFRSQDRANFGLRPLDDDAMMDDGASETTFTLRGSSRSFWSTPTADALPETTGPASTVEYSQSNFERDGTIASSQGASTPTDFIIATDFGTTFSSVAFSKRENGRWGNPQTILDYPSDPRIWGKQSLEVPTESWYPKTAIPRQAFEDFGHPIEEEEDAVADIWNAAHMAGQSPRSPESTLADSDDEMGDINPSLPLENDGANGIIWGYEIQKKLKASDMDHSPYERVERFKLLLDNSPTTKQVRDKLNPILKRLKNMGTIGTDEDVISDYLTRLFRHTKDQLTRYHSLSESASIEHVLCVPNVWSAASTRKMQKAMEQAIHNSGLGAMEDLFIVAEPEAAAAYVLYKHKEVKVSLQCSLLPSPLIDLAGRYFLNRRCRRRNS
jgi:hypothetical protein